VIKHNFDQLKFDQVIVFQISQKQATVELFELRMAARKMFELWQFENCSNYDSFKTVWMMAVL
jgi:hypothetical protein